MGILAADNNIWLMIALMVAGASVLVWFFYSVRAEERAGKEPLLSLALFRNRTSNLGLITQNVQWLLLLGSSFTVSAYLQVVRGYDAIQTGVIFTAATAGHSGLLPGRRAIRQAAPAAQPHHRGIHRHDRRCRGSARPGARLPERVGVRARSAPDRAGARHDADTVGEHRAIQLSANSFKARYPVCLGACPTSAPHSGQP